MASRWSTARLGDMTGKTVIVTGATNGLGLATAAALTRAGAHVVMAVRNTELGAQRAGEIGGHTSVVRLDLADLSSVRAFPGLLDERGIADVDILINNAGTLTESRTETVDGFETTIGTNVLGPFALTNLLLDRVRAQVINVGSQAHESATLRLDDMHLRTNKWTVMGAYARSKLVGMLWGLELDRRLRAAQSPIVSHLTHPGWVNSNLPNVFQSPLMGVLQRGVNVVAGVVASDVDASAATTLYCITEPIPPGSFVGVDGRFGLRGVPALIGRSALASDYAVAARVFQFAEQETGTTLPIGPSSR